MEDNWKDKYDQLLVNFKDLDKYNDVLYRCFHLARSLRDQELTEDLAERFKQSITDVERFEDDLYRTRKGSNRPSEEDESR